MGCIRLRYTYYTPQKWGIRPSLQVCNVPRDEKRADEEEDAHEEGVGHVVAPDRLEPRDHDGPAPVAGVDVELAGVLVRLHRIVEGREVRPVPSPVLESVQQSHFGSPLTFRHSNLQIEMQIGAQMRRSVIPHLKPISNTSKLED